MPIYTNKEYLRIIRPLPTFVQRDLYGIPVIEASAIDISSMNNGLWMINMKNASANDPQAKQKIVHTFCFDDTLTRAYNNIIKYLSKIGSYYAVSSFDFTMDEKMDFKHILDATYNNRWSGAFLQANGKLVIPTVGWANPNSYDICFSGLRDGGVFIISTLGVKNTICYPNFIHGYKEMRRRFPNTQIISIGKRLYGMDDDICYVEYKESFGHWKHQTAWQLKLFNWDNSIPKEVLG